MLDDVNPFGDEQAKAGQEVAKFGVTAIQATEQLGTYVARVLGTVPHDTVGVVIGEHCYRGYLR